MDPMDDAPTNPQVFKFDDVHIRVLFSDEIEVVGQDIAMAFGRRTAHDVTRLARPGEKRKAIVGTEGGPQSVVVVNESGLERIVKRLRTKSAGMADRFWEWFGSTVIPAGRSVGAVAATANDPGQSGAALAEDAPGYSLRQGFSEINGARVRSEIINEEIRFSAKDLAHALGYEFVWHMLELLSERKGAHGISVRTLFDDRWLTLAEVWEIVNSSRKPAAKRMRDFTNKDVMPSVSTKGGYVHPEAVEAGVTLEQLTGPAPAPETTPAPSLERQALELLDDPERMLELALAECRRRKVAEAERDAALALAAARKEGHDAWQTFKATGTCGLPEVVAILDNWFGIKIDTEVLTQALRRWKLVNKSWKPYERYKKHITLVPNASGGLSLRVFHRGLGLIVARYRSEMEGAERDAAIAKHFASQTQLALGPAAEETVQQTAAPSGRMSIERMEAMAGDLRRTIEDSIARDKERDRKLN